MASLWGKDSRQCGHIDSRGSSCEVRRGAMDRRLSFALESPMARNHDVLRYLRGAANGVTEENGVMLATALTFQTGLLAEAWSRLHQGQAHLGLKIGSPNNSCFLFHILFPLGLVVPLHNKKSSLASDVTSALAGDQSTIRSAPKIPCHWSFGPGC